MKHKYRKLELLFYVFLALFCLVFGILSMQMPFGSMRKPGQAFFPTLMSGIGLVLSILCIIETVQKIRKEAPDEEPEAGVYFSQKGSIWAVVVYIGMILFFIIFAKIIGSYVCIGLLLLILSKVQGLEGWIKPLLLTVVGTAAFYLIFGQFLGVALPSGFLI